MGRFFLRRAKNSMALLFGALALNFILLRLMIQSWGVLPESPAQRLIQLTPEELQALFPYWKLDHPLLFQFFEYVANMLVFRFGTSFAGDFRPVTELIVAALPNTLLLMGAATLLSTIMGAVTGVLTGARRGGKLDTGMLTTALAFQSVPTFWLGMMFILFLGLYIPLFPTAHTMSYPAPRMPLAYVQDVGWHLVLPAFTLALIYYGGHMLVMRNTLVNILSEDFVRTARAKGMDKRTLLYRHALRNALPSLVATTALTFGFLISGLVLTETVFKWDGLGRLFYQAVISIDYPVMHAVFYVLALIGIVASFIAEILAGFLDPRIRYG